MKKIVSLITTGAMSLSFLPSAFAQTTPPNNGFIQTANPEWSSAHETAPSDAPDHRQYHRDAETARIDWLNMNAPDRGTSMYARMHRAMLQMRNMLHRQYHIGLDLKAQAAAEALASSRSSSAASSLASSFSSSISSSRASSMSSSSSSSVRSSSSSSSSSSYNSSLPSHMHQSSVSLGAAAIFGVLAGSTVTNTGPTSVTGDLGVSPGTAVTGFGPGVVSNGAIHAGNSAAANAQDALTVSYNNLAGRSTGPVSISGNLGGSTLSPGLYKSTSGLEISTGDLTLDAQGDSNAVFIFQMATTLNVSTARRVVLIGGAKASNVYWQVGTSANLEANSVFKGSILADQSISLQTGANVEGRLLARIGGVTLQSNVITVPAN